MHQVHKQRECLCLQVRQRSRASRRGSSSPRAARPSSTGGGAGQARRRASRRGQTPREGRTAAREAARWKGPFGIRSLERSRDRRLQPAAALPASLKKNWDCASIGRKPRDPFDLAWTVDIRGKVTSWLLE